MDRRHRRNRPTTLRRRDHPSSKRNRRTTRRRSAAPAPYRRGCDGVGCARPARPWVSLHRSGPDGFDLSLTVSNHPVRPPKQPARRGCPRSPSSQPGTRPPPHARRLPTDCERQTRARALSTSLTAFTSPVTVRIRAVRPAPEYRRVSHRASPGPYDRRPRSGRGIAGSRATPIDTACHRD